MMTIAGAFPAERATTLEARRGEAFHRAQRHSRRVAWLKRSIMIVCLSTIAILFGLSYLDPFGRMPANLSVAATALNGSRITMEHPRLSGYRDDGRPYDVRAVSGVQDVRTPNIVELTDIDARVDTAEQATVRLIAPKGLFDSSKDTITLAGDVRITSESGYDIRLKSAQVDFKAGTMSSDEPVAVTLPSGAIQGNKLRISDRGKRMVMEGGVETIFKPAADAPAEPAK